MICYKIAALGHLNHFPNPLPSTSSCLLLVGKRLSLLLPCLASSTILHPHSLLNRAPTLEILRFSTPVFHLDQIPQHYSCNSRSQLNLLSSCPLCCSSSFSSFFFCLPIKQAGQSKNNLKSECWLVPAFNFYWSSDFMKQVSQSF